MQKKIIALAVAAMASGAAFAQSTNVQIYGVVDMYYGQSSASGNPAAKSVRALQNGGLSGSRIGFRGTEDLGNGLKALFTLEYGLAPDVGAGSWTGVARQSFLGLSGNFGTVLAGRLQTQGYNFAAKYDAMGAGALSPVGQLSDNNTGAGIGLSISARDALGRQDNSFAYVLPTFVEGLTLSAVYSFGTGGENVKTNAAGTDPQDIYGVAAEYDRGPLSVGFVHHNVNDFGGAKGTDQTENAIGVAYNFGVAKLFASYQTSKTETAAADIVDARLWNIGARVPVGAAGSVGLAYATFKDKEPASALKAKSWAIDYQYSLSKRTTAYAGYSRVSNGNGNAYNLLNLGAVPAAGGKESQVIVGMRHTF